MVAASVVVGTGLFESPAAAAALCATPPLTGTTAVTGVVNTYYPAQTTITAGTANPTTTVGAKRGSATAVAVGDLVLVIQMQGAQINATNTNAYGDGVVSALASGFTNTSFFAGQYEYATVTSVVGTTVGLKGAGANGGLVNGYVNANATAAQGQQRFQLVRVPQYSSATLNAATAAAWDGSSGGVVVLDVANDLNLSLSTINVTGLGFRGGLQRNRTGPTSGLFNTDYRTPTSSAANGQKAEGIAGTPKWTTGAADTVGDGYPNGDFGRGAPGNGGGGGNAGVPDTNSQTSGGGGGGNAGAGGHGGFTWSTALDTGGYGGAVVPGTASRVFLGGGGGAGVLNDTVDSSSGAAGGGMVLLRAGSLSGNGTITADGAPGGASGADGGGGGGAGGSVVVLTTGAVSGIGGLTVNARGGAGGNTTAADLHGPGGGGGGGQVITSAATAATTVSGGLRGVNVPIGGNAYGATSGTAGAASTTAVIANAPGTNTGSQCIDASVTKTVGASPVIPGQTVTYTVVATNNGPYPRSGTAPITVTDTLPADLSAATWTCIASAGSSCTASGNGSLNTTANLEVGDSATYTITATLLSTFTGTLSNTASVAGPGTIPELNAANNPATAAALAEPRVNLGVTKTDGAAVAVPGTNVTYTIVASNAGPSTATGAPITDPLPVGATSGTWTCSGGSCGAASGAMPMSTTATLAPSGSVTYTVTVAVSSTATGSLANSVTIAAPAGAVETNSANNVATDTDSLTPTADLVITKTDGATTEVPGTSVSYTIVASNAGPSKITAATVADSIPATLTGVTWTCAASAGSSCPASGSGSINASVTLVTGGTATFTVGGTISSSATGSLVNTATIALPVGATDPTPGNNSATDTDTLTPTADLAITKTDGSATAVPGSTVTYTVVASNAGPSAAVGTTITDTLPAVLSGATWTCTASAGSTCPASGSGNISATVDLLPSGTATFTLTATVASTATGSLANTATAAVASGFTDPAAANNTATDTDTLAPVADLSITKTDGSTGELPGTSVIYTIVASNAAGPSTATGAAVVDTLAGTLSGATWTCAATAGSTCPASGSGNINASVNLAPGGTATFALTATIAATATGSLTNTASIAAPAGVTDPTPGNNSSTDTDTLTPTGDLAISKTDGIATAVPGQSVTYTIVAANAGPSVITGATVADTFPATLTGAAWTCAASAGSTCPAPGTGNINTSVNLAVSGSATFSVTATVASTATGSMANTAMITAPVGSNDPNGANNTATDTDTLTPSADLSITKTDGAAGEVPGTPVTYTIVASNAGPSAAPASNVTDTFPAALTSATWICSATGGGACPASGIGSINATVGLPVGAAATFTVNATVAPGSTGSLTNTASVSVGAGVTDPTPGNNAATDTDTLTPTADLVITKTDGATTEVPGTSVAYTIIASNAGPSTITGATVADPMPASLSGVTWTCAASAGSSCPASGSGSINASVTLVTGGTATFTVNGTISSSATGSLTNTATVALPGGATDPTPANNSATDTDTLTPTADLSITKTDGAATEVPGTPASYAIVAGNAGPSAVTAATVTDTMPVALTGATWTCSASGGATCPASGSGDINATVDLPVGGAATFTVTGTVGASATGNLVNTATLAVPGGVTDPTPANNSAVDTDTLIPTADLSITKTDAVTTEVPGTSVTYTIVAGNAGPSAVTAATVVDTMAATLSGVSWACTGAAGGACPASGSGDINATVNLPVGASVTFTVTGTISSIATGNLVNTVTVAPPASVTDPTSANNSATDTDTLTPTADLSITKSDGATAEVPGTSATYTIVATNAGPSAVTAATVTDTIPAALSAATWTCAPTGGGSCAASSGSGNVNTTVDLPVGASATTTVTATVVATATGNLVNTAAITAPGGVIDSAPANNSATDTDTLAPTADLSITKSDGVTSLIPGQSTTYTVVVGNGGPSTAVNAPVSDALPAGATSGTWTCLAGPGAGCGSASGSMPLSTTATVATGASVTYTITVTVSSTATGSLANTATVQAAAGTADPDSANNSAADIDTLTPTADVSIVKTDGLSTVVPGSVVTYTVVASNPGPSTVTGATVNDTIPVTLSGATWTCSASAGSTCPASGSGDVSASVTLAPGGSATFSVTATVIASATGTITNTATITLPGTVTDPTPANNSATDLTDVTPETDLRITKTDSTSSAVPGQSTTYTAVVTNDGPSDVTGATVADTMPAGVTSMTWTCAGAGGGICTAAGSGSISDLVDLPVGASITYALTAAIVADATGTLTNTATVAAPLGVTDTNAANNSATDVDTLTPRADLVVTKDDGVTSVIPGQSTTYAVIVANNGPSDAPATILTDLTPVGASLTSWTCTAAAGAGCSTTAGSGSINGIVDLPVGTSATFTIVAAIDASATGTLSNTATAAPAAGVTDPVAGDNTGTDSDTLTPTADLVVAKTNSLTAVVPGTAVSYTITASNAGPSAVVGAAVTDTLPASITGSTWSCSAAADGSCTASGTGAINDSVDLPVGAAVTYTVAGIVAAAASGSIDNTATVSAPAGVTDPVAGNNTATDSDPLTPEVDLAITKADGLTTADPLDTVTYTIVISNAGPSSVADAVVVDTVPAALLGATWTCAAAAGGICDTAGPAAGDIDTTVDLAVDGSVQFTVTGTIAGSAEGSLINTATVSAPAGVSETDSADNSATDVTAITTTPALSIFKTDGQTTDVAGTSSTYTITVVNAGPSAAIDAAVADALPAAFIDATWTCVASGVGSCENAGPTAGDVNTTVDLPAGESATFTVTGTIDPAFTGLLANTATVAAPAGTIDDPADNSATDDTTVIAQANLVVTKDDGATTATPGGSTVYTVTVANGGPSTVTGARVLDELPNGATAMNWTCSATAGSSCTASGSGALNDTVNVVPGGRLTYLVTVDVDAAVTGTLANTATATVPATVTELTALDNTATDLDTLVAETDLAVTKTDEVSTAVPGSAAVYAIVATNNGPSDAIGATVTDTFPAELIGASWTCAGPCTASGSGALNDVVDLPVGATITFTVSATVAANATGSLANTATVTPAAGTTDPNPGNDSATDTDTLTPSSDLSITKTDGVATEVPGTPVTYAIVVTNNGPSDVIGASVIDAFASNLSNATWNCVAVSGTCPTAGTGDINTAVTLSVGGTATFTVTADLAVSATATLSNTATVAAPPATTDPNAGNNSATDGDALAPETDLSVTNTDNRLTAQPGDTVTYEIVVSNTGPSSVAGAPFSDIVPASLSGVSWTCSASAGSSCPAGGAGNAIHTNVSLEPSGTATFAVTGIVVASATGAIFNTATINAPAGVVETASGNNTATDATSVSPTADLIITKSDGLTSIVAGESISYTIVVTNSGPSTITDALITDVLPADLAGATWTCTTTPGSSCASAAGSGDIAELVTLAAGTATFTVTATVKAGAQAGTLSNTAHVAMPDGSVDSTPGDDTATDSTTIERRADLEILKSDGTTSATPGRPTQYTIVVTNNGPSNVAGAAVADALPAELSGASWTCAASIGSTCPAGGSAGINALVDVLANGTATFTVDATVAASALGTLANTATVTAPSGVTDPVPGDNSATDTDTLDPVADLAITKDDFSTTATPGAAVTYTVVVSNAGPSDVSGATVADTVPAALSGATWTCSVSGSGSCPGTGSGNLNSAVSLAVGATATYTITATLVSSATADLVNTATVTAPAGVTDPVVGNDSATDIDTLARVADLSIAKTDFAPTATPGTPVSYQIVAANSGPSDITGAEITDTPPVELAAVTWTCTATGGASCANSSGAVAINELVHLPVGGSIILTLNGTLLAGAAAPVANTAEIGVPVGATDPNPADNTATDTDTLAAVADLSITKTVDLAAAQPDDLLTYTVVVGNAGPSDIADVSVSDVVPADLVGVSWTCTALGGGVCDLAGPVNGDISTTVDLAVGGSVSFTLTGTVAPLATGTIVNTAAVAAPTGATDPAPADNTASASTAINPKADLSITKTDGNITDIAGTSIRYSIVVTSNGPSTILNAPVNDVMPAELAAVSWTCTPSAGATCDILAGSGDIAATVDLTSGASATFIVDATIASGFTGVLSNIASVTMPGSSVDPTPANNTAVDTTDIVAVADLSVTKTDGVVSQVPGTAVSYTVVVSNAGPSDVVGASVADVMPASLSNVSWSCVGAAGGVCALAGTGDVVDLVDLVSGGSVTYTVSGDLAADASGSLVNSASASVPGGVTDPDVSNNSETDTDTLVPTADLSVTKTDGVVSQVPGTAVSYTVVVSNAGPSDVVGATVTDTFPSSLLGASWTCVAVNGACPPSGSGSINAAVDLATGGSATFTVSGTVSSSATGSITNTATVIPPAGTGDPDPADNSAIDTDTLNAVADLAITKTDNDSNARPGDLLTYQIVATNAGPSAVTGAVVTDSMPAGLADVNWSCAAGSGGSCPASGSGDINANVDLAVGATVAFTVTATIAATTGVVTNTAQIDVPAGVTDPNPADDAATDTTQVDPVGDLSVTKTDGLTSAVPGAAISYIVDVTNGGPSTAVGVTISDTMPSTLAGVTWSCTATAGSACGNANGIGDIAELVDVAGVGTVSFLVTATIAVDATGTLTNTATVVSPAGFTDSNPVNDSATDVTELTPVVDLAVTKTDGQVTAVPGTPISYTIVVTNAGPSVAAGSRLVDNLPAVLTGATWTCNAAPGSSCGAASGSGSIDEIVTVGVGSTLTYFVSATVSASAVGVLANTATVTPAAGITDSGAGDNSAIDTDVLTPQASLTVVKTDGAAAAVPGTPISYTIIVTNTGPSAVTDADVVDALPVALTNASWTCSGTAGGFCGAASGTGAIATTAVLPPGATVIYTLIATIDPAATGTVANTATVATPAGVVETDTADNSSTDTDTLTPSADLSITKTDGVTDVVPGTSTSYTITVANSGPSTASGAVISDALPAEIVAATWSCTAAGGAACGTPSGSGDVSLPADLPAGGSVVVEVVADIDPAASGFVVNSATVTEPAGVIDTNAANDSATDSDTLTPVADLSITKDDGLASALPGDSVSYAVVVANNGPSAVVGASVTDVMPAGLSGVVWTCTADANSACATTSGTGDIVTTVDLAVGETATFTIDATVAASRLGAVTNTATIEAPPGVSDPNSADNVATDTTIVNGLGDVSIVKTDGVTTVAAGTSTTYTIVVTNPGPSQIDGIQVIDTLPAGLVNGAWTCAATGAAACGAISGTGSINETIDMPAATDVTFTVTADVAQSASGTLSNTASAVLPAGVVDPDPTNNTATDNTDVERIADLSVTKTDNMTELIPGNPVSYDITVRNIGPSTVTGATLADTMPATLTDVSWTCTGAAGGTCPASGSDNINASVNLPLGASVTFTVSGTVSPDASGTLVNTATVAPPAGVDDPNPANDSDTDVTNLTPVADVSVAKSNGITSQSPGGSSTYTITVSNAGPSAAPGVTILDPLPTGVTTASWTCSATAGSSCPAASESRIGAINTTIDLASAGIVTFTVSMQAGAAAGTLTNIVTASVAAGTVDPDPSNNQAGDTDTLVFTADLDVSTTSSTAMVAAGQPFTYTVVVSSNGPDPATDVTVLDTMPAGLTNTTWTCAAASGSSCPAVGAGDIAATVDLAAGGSVTFTVIATASMAAASTITNTATATVGPGTVDPDPTNNTASASVAVDFTFSLSVQKTASVSTVHAGDPYSYDIVVSNAGPARVDGVVISDPVPAGVVALSWTCSGAGGGICHLTAGTGSPQLTADLPLGGSVTITLFVRAAQGVSGPIVNVVTVTGPSGQQVTAQATAIVEGTPVVSPTATLSITNSTSAATYSAVGAVVPFTLVATNTGNVTLSNVTITDPNATIAGCAPATLAPGQTLTCSAAHVVTQADLDQGSVISTASVTGVSPAGPAVTANSASVVVPATRVTTMSLAESTPAAFFAKAGDTISYSITAKNTGNVTLTNVSISDPTVVLTDCATTTLAPGQTMTCTALHTVTAADVAAKVIVKQAHATALPVASLESVSADSNTVVLNRSGVLSRTGGDVVSKLILALALLGFGGLLLVTGRRRTRPAR